MKLDNPPVLWYRIKDPECPHKYKVACPCSMYDCTDEFCWRCETRFYCTRIKPKPYPIVILVVMERHNRETSELGLSATT